MSDTRAHHTPGFTPGPWRVDKNIMEQVHTHTIRAGGTEVAKVNKYLSRREANAALIAAAPTMYEALEVLVASIEALPSSVLDDWKPVFNARHALALARGNTGGDQ